MKYHSMIWSCRSIKRMLEDWIYLVTMLQKGVVMLITVIYAAAGSYFLARALDKYIKTKKWIYLYGAIFIAVTISISLCDYLGR